MEAVEKTDEKRETRSILSWIGRKTNSVFSTMVFISLIAFQVFVVSFAAGMLAKYLVRRLFG